MAENNMETRGLMLILLTVILSSIAVLYAYGEFNLTRTLTLWFYGLVFVLILAFAGTRKFALMQAISMALALAFIWWLVTIQSDAFVNALFLYAILVTITGSLLLREEIERAN
jgi:hypothetical protein